MTAEKIAGLLRQAANPDLELKLHSLLEAWRLKPAPELAAAIDGLAVPAYRAPTGDWEEVAEDCTEVQRAGLLQDLNGVIAVVAGRVEQIGRWARDPRTAVALQALLQRIPWTSLEAHRQIYKPAFEALARQGDPRTIQWLAEVGDRWTLGGKTGARLEKSRASADRLLEKELKGRDFALTETEVELIAEAVGTRSFRKGRADEEAKLLAQIHANPDDDGPRAVYSDLLLERAEPWGEVIALQLTKELSGPQKERLAKLEKTHWRRWCGPMTPFVVGPKFTRGFLSGGAVQLGQRTLPPTGGHWALFEELTIHPPDDPTDTVRAWCAAVRPMLTRLKRLLGAPSWLADALLPEGASSLEEIADCGLGWLRAGGRTVPRLVKAQCSIESPADLEGMAALGAAPALRELELQSEVPNTVTVAAAVLRAPALSLVSMSVDDCSHALSRGHDGTLSELWTGTAWARRNAGLFTSLPADALTRVVLSQPVDPAEGRRWFANQTRLERIDSGFSASCATGGGPCGTPVQFRAAAAHWAILSVEGAVTLYDPKRLRPLLQRRLAITDGGKAVVSPDGHRIAGETLSGLQITPVGSHDETMDLRTMRPIGFSDDGQRLWCADGDLTTCIDVATRHTLYTVRAPHRTLAIDAGSAVILVDEISSKTTVCGRNPEQPLRVLDGEGGLWAALSGTGRLVTLDRAGQVRIAEGLTAPLKKLGPPIVEAKRVVVSADGRKIVAGKTVLDAATGTAAPLEGPDGVFDFAADGRLVCATAEGPRVC